MRLQDKVAIVTGGGSGFGEGIAKAYAREGACVVLADIDAGRGRRPLASACRLLALSWVAEHGVEM